MIKELRVYWALRPTIKQFQELMKMKVSVNSVVQMLGLALQGLNQISGFIPSKYQFYVAVGTAAIQGLVGVLAHFSNPDGTAAATPYAK